MSVPKSSDGRRDSQLEITFGSVDAKQLSTEVLPKADKSFCFTAEDFADDSFSVDSFLKTNRLKVTLEQLKDDLSSYLKVLKTSMVELINEDYNDFINLTTNLMGFDKSINNLSQPLVKLRDQSQEIEGQFSDLIRHLEDKSTRLETIRRNKSQMNKIISVMNYIKNAENWFNCYKNSDDCSDGETKDLSALEKIGLIVIKTEVLMKSIVVSIPLVSKEIIPRFRSISDSLYVTLESEFFSSITNNRNEELITILRIYSLSGRQSQLESLFQQRVVKPYMDEVICETFLEKHGIDHFFHEILEFIDLKCRLIIDVNENDFNFMINSVWNEVCNCLLVRTPSVFSAGNPDQFHNQYLSANEFVENFINKSHIKRNDLEKQSNYKELMNKFNIEVYFHIRFQQIVTRFESILEENTFDANNDSNLKFKFLVTKTLFDCLSICWSPQTVYLSALFPSFLRLTFQLLSRYSFWLQNIKDSDLKSNEVNPLTNQLSNKIVLLGLLIADCETVINESKSFFDSIIVSLKPSYVSSDQLNYLFDESIELLKKNGSSNVVNLMKNCLVSQCDLILRQVSDLPRLYRKTNKEVPTKASNYIFNCFDLIASIVLNETKVWKSEWTRHILNEITSHFKYFTSEVLISVQKIEDSLKRLKKSKTLGIQNNQIRKVPSNMSDDDKIRLQIYYDVEEYGKQIEDRLGIEKNSIDSFTELSEMTNANKIAIN